METQLWIEDEELDAIPENEEEVPSDINAHEAERQLVALGHLERDLKAHEDHARAEIERIERWLAEKSRKLNRAIAWRKKVLRWFLTASGQKTLKLVNGTLRIRPGRESVSVIDEDAFLAWASTHNPELIRVKKEADRKAIAAYVKTTGELPDGVNLERSDRSFTVTTATG